MNMAKSTIGDFLVKGDEGGIDARQVGVAPGSVHLEALEPARAVLRERPQQGLDLAGELPEVIEQIAEIVEEEEQHLGALLGFALVRRSSHGSHLLQRCDSAVKRQAELFGLSAGAIRVLIGQGLAQAGQSLGLVP
jgi:hypothetical protein